jgi:hypothetical protein
MKKRMLLVVFTGLFLCVFAGSEYETNKPAKDNLIEGKWVRLTQSGPVGLEFHKDGTTGVDFGIDGTVDVVSEYEMRNDTIFFMDKKGEMCPEPGIYTMEIADCYAAFDLVDDMCNGRIKMTMGFWTKPNFEELLGELTQKISETENTELYLSRARVKLALGKSFDAKTDLDVYLEQNPDDTRALINRAGTRFPDDMEGVISDCNKAIELESENKNAWFLRGLANWELGFKERACGDFSRAIDLGFSILQMAEEQRCREYWDIKKED